MSSHSGSITVAVSLREPVTFLPSVQGQSSSSYREHDSNNTGVTGDDVSGSPAVAGESADAPPSPDLRNSPGPGSGSGSGHGSNGNSRHAAGTGARPPSDSDVTPAILQGSILLKLTKPTKLKSLGLSFYGKCKTHWSGAFRQNMFEDPIISHTPPDINDEYVINYHQWEFLPYENAPRGPIPCEAFDDPMVAVTTVSTNLYGADAAKFKDSPEVIHVKDPSKVDIQHHGPCQTVYHSNAQIPLFGVNPTYWKRPPGSHHPTHFGGHLEPVTFPAGEYVYNFTLALDPSIPESVDVANGSIKYYLMPKVVRGGTFALNLSDHQEVTLVRSPPSTGDSLVNNPIAISRAWDGRLHYEIIIPQKSIPLGTSIPMAIKLTPLEKVMVHRVRVHVHETVEYKHSVDSEVNYTDRSLKILLFEKKASTTVTKGTITSTRADGSTVTTTHDEDTSNRKLHFPSLKNTLGHDSGKKARERFTGNLLQFGRLEPASQPQSEPHSGPSRNASAGDNSVDTDAAVTTLDCTLPFISDPQSWDPKSGESSSTLDKNSNHGSSDAVKVLHPDTNSSPHIRVRHRLTVSLRISKKDPSDTKRRHFEVKIDTPVIFLSKHCIQENINLPKYNYQEMSKSLQLGRMWASARAHAASGAVSWENVDGLPSFDDVLARSADFGDPVVDGNGSDSSPPPEYEDIVSEDDRRQYLER